MEEKCYTVKGGTPHSMPPLLGTEALAEAGASDLRVLLALCELGSGTVGAIAKALGCETATVTAALAFWRGAGIVTTAGGAQASPTGTEKKTTQKQAAELRELGAAELADYIKDSDLESLVTAAEQQRGRLFNRSDLSILISLSQELGLSGAYILTLLAYCDGQGDGTPKPLRYAERVAFRLAEHGIDTCEALEEYIREQETLHSVEGGLRRMFGIGTRKLTEREEKAFLTWTREYGYGEEIIGAAYDVTVNATGKASVAYAARILAHWHEEGVTTLEAAEALLAREREEKKPRGRRAAAPPPPADGVRSSFDIGDFFQRAVDRSFKAETADDQNG